MAVAGNFATVIKVVEHTELQSQLMFVGRDVRAIHGQRRIAGPYFQVTEHLVVRAIFFKYVNDVMDGVGAMSKVDFAGIGVQQVVFLYLAG